MTTFQFHHPLHGYQLKFFREEPALMSYRNLFTVLQRIHKRLIRISTKFFQLLTLKGRLGP